MTRQNRYTTRRAAFRRLRTETSYTRRRMFVYSLGLPTRYSSEQVIRYNVEDFRFAR